jgi:hypothetical protein
MRIFNSLIILLIIYVVVRCNLDIEGSQAYDNSYRSSLSTIEREKIAYDSIGLNYDHVHTYSFQVSRVEDFIVAIETDHVIRGTLRIY